MLRIILFKHLLLIVFLVGVVVLCCGSSPIKSERFLLIAHRGGVVDDTLSENSLRGLEEAIRRGYTHVEVDTRITLDGHLVCFHDDNLLRETGVNKRIAELTLDELKQIKLIRCQETIPTFDEFCRRCAGRIDLMVDPKGVEEHYLNLYVDEMEAALSRHGLLANALFIQNRMPVRNQEKVVNWFLGRAKTAWRYDPAKTQYLAYSVPDPGKYHFVFNSPRDFTKEMIEGFQKMGLKVIPSINLTHYPTGDPMQQGLADVEKMLDWGVDGLQIDSCFDPVVFARLRPADGTINN